MNKIFARSDYEGLSQSDQQKLRAERSKIAQELSRQRSEANKTINGIKRGDPKFQTRNNLFELAQAKSTLDASRARLKIDTANKITEQNKILNSTNNNLINKSNISRFNLGNHKVALGVAGTGLAVGAAALAYRKYKQNQQIQRQNQNQRYNNIRK